MREYFYKGFQVCYQVKKDAVTQLYKADGTIVSSLDKGKKIDNKFHTEDFYKLKAEKEIKKNIESFIDFEWSESLECHDLPSKGV